MTYMKIKGKCPMEDSPAQCRVCESGGHNNLPMNKEISEATKAIMRHCKAYSEPAEQFIEATIKEEKLKLLSEIPTDAGDELYYALQQFISDKKKELNL